MRFNNYYIILLLLPSIFLIECESGPEQDTVAQIGKSEKITIQDVKSRVLSNYVNKYWSLEHTDNIDQTLDELINEKLILLAALEEDMDVDATVLNNIKDQFNKALVNEFYDRECVDKVITEKDIQEYYTKNITAGKSLIDARMSIRKLLITKHKKEISNIFNTFVKEYVVDDSFVWNDSILLKLGKLVEESDFEWTLFKSNLEKFVINNGDQEILSHLNGQFTCSTLLQKIDEWPPDFSLDDLLDINGLKPYIRKTIAYDYIVKLAKEKEYDQSDAVQNSIKKSLEKAMVERYKQIHVTDLIPNTDDELIKFYEIHKKDLFYQLASANAYVIVEKDSVKANELIQKYHQGVNFKDLAQHLHFKIYTRRRDSTVIPEDSILDKVVGKVVFDLKKNQVIGPLKYKDEENENSYAIIQKLGGKLEKQLPFDEVKELVRIRYHSYKAQELETTLYRELKKKYPIVVNKEWKHLYTSDKVPGFHL